jgi:hypothetical protein
VACREYEGDLASLAEFGSDDRETASFTCLLRLVFGIVAACPPLRLSVSKLIMLLRTCVAYVLTCRRACAGNSQAPLLFLRFCLYSYDRPVCSSFFPSYLSVHSFSLLPYLSFHVRLFLSSVSCIRPLPYVFSSSFLSICLSSSSSSVPKHSVSFFPF